MRGYIIYDFYFLFVHNICNWSGEVEDICPKTTKIMTQFLKSLKQSLFPLFLLLLPSDTHRCLRLRLIVTSSSSRKPSLTTISHTLIHIEGYGRPF